MYELIKEILVEKLGIEDELIKPEACLERDLELDSTETVVVALELKKRLGISYEFPEQDLSLQELAIAISNINNK